MDIFTAIIENRYDIVKRMILKDDNDVNEINDQGLSLLHICATYGHVETAKVLIENGANLNIKDVESGWTPLHRSIYFKHVKLSLLLIKAGSKFDKSSSSLGYDSLVVTSSSGVKGKLNQCHNNNDKISPNNDIEDKEGLTPIDLISKILSPYLKTSTYLDSRNESDLCDHFNEVMCFGKSDFMLGVPLPNSSSDVTRPRTIDSLVYLQENIQQIVASKFHSMAISSDGNVYSWGHGRGGRLGHGDEVAQLEPKVICSLSGRFIVSIASSDNHTIALTNTGDVYSWGSDKFGQLGHGNKGSDNNKVMSPRRIESLKKIIVVGVAVGDCHSICFSAKGDLYSWGSNQHGQLGLKSSELTATSVPKKLSFQRNYSSTRSSFDGNNALLLLADCPVLRVSASYSGTLLLYYGTDSQVNEVYQFGHGIHYPTKVHFSNRNASRRKRSVSLTDFQNNNNNDFSCSSSISAIINITDISAGKHHNVALSQDGIVYTWGLGADQLGHGSGGEDNNSNNLCQPQVVEALLQENGGGRIVNISASSNRTCAVSDLGDLFTWGSTYEKGVLGPNCSSYQPIPHKINGIKRAIGVSAGEDHTLVLVSSNLPALPLSDVLDALADNVDIVNNLPREEEESESNIFTMEEFNNAKSTVENNNIIFSLKDLCQRQVANFVNIKNAIGALIFAERYDAQLLSAYILQFIEMNFDAVITLTKPSSMDRFADDIGFSTLLTSSSPTTKAFNPYSHNFSVHNSSHNVLSKDNHRNNNPKKTQQDDSKANQSFKDQPQEKFDPDNIIKSLTNSSEVQKQMRSMKKKLLTIEDLEKKQKTEKYELSKEQESKVSKKYQLQLLLSKLEHLKVQFENREGKEMLNFKDDDIQKKDFINQKENVKLKVKTEKDIKNNYDNSNSFTKVDSSNSLNSKSNFVKKKKISIEEFNNMIDNSESKKQSISQPANISKSVPFNFNDWTSMIDATTASKSISTLNSQAPQGLSDFQPPDLKKNKSKENLSKVDVLKSREKVIYDNNNINNNNNNKATNPISLSSALPNGRTVLSPPSYQTTKAITNSNISNISGVKDIVDNNNDISSSYRSAFNLAEYFPKSMLDKSNNSTNSNKRSADHIPAWTTPKKETNSFVQGTSMEKVKTSKLNLADIQAEEERIKQLSNSKVKDKDNKWFIERKPRAESFEEVMKKQLLEKEEEIEIEKEIKKIECKYNNDNNFASKKKKMKKSII